MPRIFINFRGDDSGWAGDLLWEKLAQRFGETSVFKSNKSIPLGAPWPDSLREAARTCDVLLALIGPAWLTIRDADGRPRIFADDDWVRREIATALAAGRIVAAVRLDDTPRLTPDSLPADIRELASHQDWRLDRRQFDAAYAGLEQKIRTAVPSLRPRRPRLPGPTTTVNSVLFVGDMKGDSDVTIFKDHSGDQGSKNFTSHTEIDRMDDRARYSTYEAGEEDEPGKKEERG